MKIETLRSLLWQSSPNLFFISITLSAIVGVAYSLLIPFLLYAIDSDAIDPTSTLTSQYTYFNSPISDLAKLFLVSLLSIVFFKTLSIISTIYIGAKATIDVRIRICRKIYAMSSLQLDAIGQASLISLINVDVQRIANAAQSLPIIYVSTISILGVLGYLLYIDSSIFVFIVFCLAVAILSYQLPMYIGSKLFRSQRDLIDKTQSGVRGLILGAKELKLDKTKFENIFIEEVVVPENSGNKYYMSGITLIVLGESYGEIISLIVTSIVVFHLSFFYGLTQTEVFSVVMALLYLTGPVGFVLGAMSQLQLAKISVGRINNFFLNAIDEDINTGGKLHSDWDKVELRNVEFSYPNKSELTIKPVSAIFERGKIHCIVGGNGSGKSTLAKILSTHFPFTGGDLLFGVQSVKDLSLQSVRDSISVIYTDFHLFPGFYKDYPQDEVDKYLSFLDLQSIVKIADSSFNTIALSDGQKKRLAMLQVLLEDRPICIFDEWAADQDPRFKEVFYFTILPILKEKNKIVIVITHDDRYFSIADQILVMENGCLQKDRKYHF